MHKSSIWSFLIFSLYNNFWCLLQSGKCLAFCTENITSQPFKCCLQPFKNKVPFKNFFCNLQKWYIRMSIVLPHPLIAHISKIKFTFLVFIQVVFKNLFEPLNPILIKKLFPNRLISSHLIKLISRFFCSKQVISRPYLWNTSKRLPNFNFALIVLTKEYLKYQ